MNVQSPWNPIMPLNAKGEYIHLNEENGKITYIRQNRPINGLPSPMMSPNITSVADICYRRFKGHVIDDWFLNPYRKWERKFAKENPEAYNRLINLPLQEYKVVEERA